MHTIFISYRRGDTAGHAQRLYADLVEIYGRGKVFFDTGEIEPGTPFPETIRESVDHSKVVLVVIGERWATIEGEDGRRRLDDPGDWVVAEIGRGLEMAGRVIPVTVAGTQMPPATRLPQRLEGLASIQAIELSATRWDHDLKRLRKQIDRRLAGGRRRSPLRSAAAAALGGFLVAALAWLTDLESAIPGGGWLRSASLGRMAERTVPTFREDRLAILALEEGPAEGGAAERAERRTAYADLLDRLTELETRAVILDLYFERESLAEADRRLAASLRAAREAGVEIVAGTRREPAGSHDSGLPEELRRELTDGLGLVALFRTELGGGPLIHLEIARLRSDPALDASGEVWASLALRAAMIGLDADRALYDGSRLLLQGPAGELRRAIPVDLRLVSNPDDPRQSRHVLFAYVHLMSDERLAEFQRTEPSSDLGGKLVVVGSSREQPRPELGELVGYQVHAQIASQLLGSTDIRRAGAGFALPALLMGALAGGVWRRRKRLPLAISDPRSPYAHWLASVADLAIAALVLGIAGYLVALVAFKTQRLLLPVFYPLLAFAGAYLLLALLERHRSG